MSRQPPDVWIWGFKNIGLLCIKPPYFRCKTSVLLPKEVRCFWFPERGRFLMRRLSWHWHDNRDGFFLWRSCHCKTVVGWGGRRSFLFFTADTLFDVRWWGGYKPPPPPIMYNYALFVVLHMRAQNLHTRAHNQYYGWCRSFSEAFRMLRVGAS